MNDQEKSRSRSPFSELSFSEQQEMWRLWRAQPLEYKDIAAKALEPEVLPPPPAPPQPYMPPSHQNLDRVHARISAAAARAGAFHPLT
ncbi:MAG: hypothetical protein IKM26_02745 [Clostridia bacterium]|nr:hypothetical protein [Clostridia bacterium]